MEIAYFTGLPIHEQSPICPSALPDVNVPQLLEQIIEEKAYKNDYDNLTTQLLEEQIPYEIVIDSLKNIAKSNIFKEGVKFLVSMESKSF